MKKIWDGLSWNLIGWNNFQKEPYHSQLFADIALFTCNYGRISYYGHTKGLLQRVPVRDYLQGGQTEII